MTREEYHKTTQFLKLRFLHNKAFSADHDLQELRDVLEILLEENPSWVVHDRFTMVVDQMRIARLEIQKLRDRCMNLAKFLEPELSDSLFPKEKVKGATNE